VNGENGEIVDMKDFGVWEAYSVKAQTYKTAIEVRLQIFLRRNFDFTRFRMALDIFS